MKKKKKGRTTWRCKPVGSTLLGTCFRQSKECAAVCNTALEATQGQMDGFFTQLPYKCRLEEVASVGD